MVESTKQQFDYSLRPTFNEQLETSSDQKLVVLDSETLTDKPPKQNVRALHLKITTVGKQKVN